MVASYCQLADGVITRHSSPYLLLAWLLFLLSSFSHTGIAVREEEARREAAAMGAGVDYLRLPLYNRSSTVADDDVAIVEACVW